MRTALTAAAPPTAITGASTGLFGQSYADKGTLPAQSAGMLRTASGELAMLTWGMPSPPQYVTGRADRGVTNISDVNSPHWRRWLGVGHRCGCLPRALPPNPGAKAENKPLLNAWFALSEDKPLAFFAGLSTPRRGVRRMRDGEHDFELYGFLTMPPNAVVQPSTRRPCEPRRVCRRLIWFSYAAMASVSRAA